MQAGPTKPSHEAQSYPGTPDSANVGRSGEPGHRRELWN